MLASMRTPARVSLSSFRTTRCARPETDHTHSSPTSADETGGRLLAPGDMAKLEELLPNRQVRIVTPSDHRALWDTPLMLGLLLILACTEWVGRKLVRLV
jgi:hypothetical protein